MCEISPLLCYIFLFLPVSGSLRIEGLSFQTIFCYYCSFCLWHVVRFKYIVCHLYEVFSFLYLSSALQLNVDCCMIGMPIFGTAFYHCCLFSPQQWSVLLLLLPQLLSGLSFAFKFLAPLSI